MPRSRGQRATPATVLCPLDRALQERVSSGCPSSMQILHTPENKGFLMATETLDTSKNQGTVEAPNAISLVYTNYRGETSVRRVIPQRIWFGATDWHPEN